MIVEFGKAIVHISDVLPRVSISAQLYQTDDMRDAIARLYSDILLFSMEAIRWFKFSRLKHAISSVFSPYELKYKDMVDRIHQCATVIAEIAQGKHQAEMRDMHIGLLENREENRLLEEKVDRIEGKVNEVLALVTSQSMF
jgi:hypothetical protein